MPFLALLLVLLVPLPCFSQMPTESPDQLWQVGDRRWTVEEEQRFAKWVEENITEDFFIRYRIPTDCADAVYAIRWIYARIAGLPAAATTKEGKLIGHWSTDWKHLPTHPEWDKDERFRAALLYLLPRTWTGTLPFDTYPVRVTPDSITPGTLFLVTESHTGIVARVVRDGSHAHPILTWESALPVKVQQLNLRFFFSTKPDVKGRSGLVKFRWPISENGDWTYLPVEAHPFYSEEQYAPDFCANSADFVETVGRRIDPTKYPPMEKMAKVIGTVTQLLRERVSMVLVGFEKCQNGGCPEPSELWETHSTAGRDALIVSLLDHLSEIIESNQINRETAKRMMEAISVEIAENHSVTLYHVYQNRLWLSHRPDDSIDARWGLKKCETIYAQTRVTRETIAFIEKTYRRKDPRYADFTIRTQQQLLGKLNEEWTKSGCKEPPPALAKRLGRAFSSVHRKSCKQIRAEIRATRDAIAFIEKTYRGRDSEYADFAIRTQQQLLERLNEAWNESDCGKLSYTPEKKRPATRQQP